MKFFILLTTLIISSAQADTKLLHQKTVVLPVNVSSAQLLLSNAGYGEIEILKIIVPELADVTFLNHRNPTAGGPCLATYESVNPQDIIQGKPGIEKVAFKVKLIKNTYKSGNRCTITMYESVEGNVRGYNFTHTVVQEMPERKIEDCR
jgi:hypothetical protein